MPNPEHPAAQPANKRAFGRRLSDLWLDGEEGKLHPAEWELLRCAAVGEACVVGDERPTSPTKENRVRAELLRFIALGGDEQNPLHDSGIQLRCAYVESNVNGLELSCAIIPKNILLNDCCILGPIILFDASTKSLAFRGCKIEALYASRLQTSGSLFLDQGFVAQGIVNLNASNISGGVSCSNGTFKGVPLSLNLDGSEINGAIWLNEQFCAAGLVRLNVSTIKGDLDCRAGLFKSTPTSIYCDGASISGSVYFDQGFTANGEVHLVGSNVDGHLSCRNGTFSHSEISIYADSLKIQNRVDLSENFKAAGEIRFINTTILGDLDCRRATLQSPLGTLYAQRAEIFGDVFLDDDFLSFAPIDLTDTTIHGNLRCDGGTFSNKEKSIHAPRATIHGSVYLGKECRAAGPISFQSATIDGDITFAGGSFESRDGINLRNAEIKGMLVWRNVDYARGELNLAGASCLSLNMDWKSWEKPAQIRLDNFTYQRFAELPDGCNGSFWINWLERQPQRHLKTRFRPNPYQNLAKVLDQMGHEAEAKDVRIERMERQRLFSRYYEPMPDDAWAYFLRRMGNSWKWVQKKFIGYGYRPALAVIWLLGLILVGTGIYELAARKGVMAPTHPLIFKEAVWEMEAGDLPTGKIPIACRENWVYPAGGIKATCQASVASEYSTFNAFIYSVDTAIPVVNFRMEADWSPRVVNWKSGTPDSLGWWVRTWEWLQIGLGWLFSLLLVGAWGGVIKRD